MCAQTPRQVKAPPYHHRCCSHRDTGTLLMTSMGCPTHMSTIHMIVIIMVCNRVALDVIAMRM